MWHLIKLGQVRIQHDLVAAHDVNAAFNQFNRYRELLWGHFVVRFSGSHGKFAVPI